MNVGSGDIKIFAGTSGKTFAKRMCDFLGAELGNSEVITFSDGNIFVRIRETVRDKDVFLVQPIAMNPNNELVEILFWIDAFKRASANSVTVIVPYFGYAKGDKKDEPRVSIRARVCADMIECAGADRTVMMDLHADQIQGFFKTPMDHLEAMPIICEYIKTVCDLDNLVVVSPDAGFAKNAREFADYLGVGVAIGDKTRYDHSESAKVLDVIGNVEGKDCFIVDDFTISGGTLVEIANAVKANGARRIFAGLSHILCREKGVKAIENSPIEFLVSTDTVENPYIKDCEKIKIVSVAPLFAEAAKCIHDRVSISGIFDRVPAQLVEQMTLEMEEK
ncbi:MAG: ribose-phosphate pyrophosphokinase [Clostridiales bacterium]|nr:ribose-phosphate pyrophosphokinase [Clostridiales bacterium]